MNVLAVCAAASDARTSAVGAHMRGVPRVGMPRFGMHMHCMPMAGTCLERMSA